MKLIHRQIAALIVLLAVITMVFAVALPHLRVDRISEYTYMGVPYKMFKAGHLSIADGDPFVENGPHAVFVSAAIAYYSHSLKPMRYYHFVYMAIIIGWLFWLLQRQFERLSRSWIILGLSVLLVLSVWISIPLILIYPIQFNGMTPGFLCFLAALLLNGEHPYGAALMLGCAYSFKGQFLAMLPGWMLYKVVIENRFASWKARVAHAGACFILFFVPTTVLLTVLARLFHFFNDTQELKAYAWRAPSILFDEMSAIGQKMLHLPSASPDKATQAVRIRHTEYSGFGCLTWSHIIFSMSFCFWAAANPLWNRWRGQESKVAPFLSLFGAAGFLYWLNYLFFWSYPFWYNTLPVVFFNLFAIPYAVLSFQGWITRHLSERLGLICLVGVSLVLGGYFLKDIYRTPGWHDRAPGDSLEPYSWMP